MTDRRKRPPNRWGCKPTEDVCVEHDEPLVCRHGCEKATAHQCAESGGAGAVVELFSALKEALRAGKESR